MFKGKSTCQEKRQHIDTYVLQLQTLFSSDSGQELGPFLRALLHI